MARFVVPGLFALRLGGRDDAVDLVPRVQDAFGPLLRKRADDKGEIGVPVSLRWGLNPVIGFPRSPFEVWRRTRRETPATPVAGQGPRTAPARVELANPVLEIRFDAVPAPGAALTVEALSADDRTLPGQRLRFDAAGSGRFRAAGIAALRLDGSGRIENIGALSQNDWANLPDWQRVEIVGFPFEPGSLAPDVYDVDARQGWEVAALTGPEAAELRMGVAQILQLDPPAVGAGGLVAPPWPFPDPARFLDVLRRGPLDDARACLVDSDDLDLLRLQAVHARDRAVPGLHQPAFGTPSTTATLRLRTTQYGALAVQDGPVALGLGFGTTDLPPPTRPFETGKDVLPPGTTLGSHEYMVTARIVLPLVGGPFELAAIGHREAPPTALTGLTATRTFENRATIRDGEESVAVSLGWTPTVVPVGAGVLARRPPDPTTTVNTPRPDSSGGFQPYLTEHRIAPDGTAPSDLRPAVTLPEEAVPRSGSATTSYAVAPLDGHGRWGPWTVTAHTVTARAVQVPGVHSPALTLPAPTPPTAPVAAGTTLSVEVSWDWADRSCHHIEVSALAVPPGPLAPDGAPPPTITGFQSDNTQPAGAGVVVTFSPAGVPSVPAPATVEPVTIAPTPGAASEIRRYRLTVPGLRLSFAAADELAWAVTARGAETVRPAETSAQATPQAITVGNPFPAAPPAIPQVTVLWTAQPDAAGRARTVLSWPPVPGAAGYTVWEATETALYAAVTGGGSPETGPLRTRAQDLKARVLANQAASMQTFTRLTERPLTGTSVELVLPGSADTIYVYRLASVTAQNIESAKSSQIVLVGVPRREIPPTPRLEATADAAAGEVTLTVVPGAGIAPDRLRCHRVRRAALADQLGTMGPARVGPVAVADLTPVPTPTGEPGFALVDPAEPSWVPYVYRAVATGRELPDDGIRGADSAPSAPVVVLVTPPLPPLLTASRVVSANGQVLTVRTDLPWVASPAGTGTLQVAAVDADLNRTVLVTLTSHEIPVGPPGLPAGPVSGPSATRQPPAGGVAEVSIVLPPTPGTPIVTATDPLGRSTAVEVS